MKLGDEKRALQEISSLKRSRRTVESFQADQEAIEADRSRTEELRKQLDDPEAKAISERYDAIRSELDEIKKSTDEAFAGRNKLFDERNALSAELDALFNRKRESAQRYREASDRYWQKVNEERARRAERQKAQRAAEEEEKRKEIGERLLEEAKAPAFEEKIEDCQTLIDYFNAKVAGGSTPVPPPTSLSSSKQGVNGVPKLELRQVEELDTGNLTPRKKKGENEENYFVGGKGKGKKGNKTTVANTSSSSLNLPLSTLNALLALSIPPPSSPSDLPRVVEDLKTKKAWFEGDCVRLLLHTPNTKNNAMVLANQERVTAENISKAEQQIKRLAKGGVKAESFSTSPSNGKVEKPSEPTTDVNSDEPSDAAASEAAEDKLEESKNHKESMKAEVETVDA